MTVKGGPNKACAACKFQRRRCSLDCSLAPFFPAHHPKIFHNVHRLFGVSKVIKILRKMRNHEQKNDVMKSIIYESNIREKFPVHGCFGIILQLHQELQQATQELHYVRAQLSVLKQNSSLSSQIMDSYDHLSENNDNGIAFYTEEYEDQTKSLFNLNNYMSDVTSDNNKLLEIQTQLSDSNAFGLDPNQVGEACDQDYDIINFYAIDDLSSKEACESSSESSSKDIKQVQLVPKNELKTAAAYFSLMNIN